MIHRGSETAKALGAALLGMAMLGLLVSCGGSAEDVAEGQPETVYTLTCQECGHTGEVQPQPGVPPQCPHCQSRNVTVAQTTRAPGQAPLTEEEQH
jgi:hypothetical protein